MYARACSLCRHDVPHHPPPPPSSWDARHLGAHGRAVRRPLPRRARRLDGRHGPALDRDRPRPHHLPAAVGRVGLRARLRRPAAARRPRRRPARPPARAARSRSPCSPSPRPLGGLVDDGTLLVATRFLKGAAAAFTAPAGLSIITTTFAEGPARNRALSIYTATRRQRVLARPRVRRPADRARLALDVPAAGADRARACWPPRRACSPRDILGPGRRGRFDFAGRGDADRRMLLLVRTVVEAPSAGWGAPETLGGLRAVAAPCWRRSWRSSGAPPTRSCGSAILRSGSLRAGQPRRDDAVRRLLRLPVRRHALPAGA